MRMEEEEEGIRSSPLRRLVTGSTARRMTAIVTGVVFSLSSSSSSPSALSSHSASRAQSGKVVVRGLGEGVEENVVVEESVERVLGERAMGTEAIGGRLGRASVRSVASCQSSRAGIKDGGIPDVGQVSFAGSVLALHTLVTSFAEGGSCSRSRCFGHRGGVGWWRSAARSAAVAAGPRAARRQYFRPGRGCHAVASPRAERGRDRRHWIGVDGRRLWVGHGGLRAQRLGA